MRVQETLGCLAVVGALVIGCQRPGATFSASDEAALRALNDSATAYMRSGNWSAWAGLYAEEGRILPPNGRVVAGRAAVQKFGESLPPVESAQFSDVKVTGSGDVAYLTSAYSLKLKGVPADTGKQLVAFRRQSDGNWKADVVAFNSDLAPPASAATPNGSAAKK